MPTSPIDRRRLFLGGGLFAGGVLAGSRLPAAAADGSSDPVVDGQILAFRELVRAAAKAGDRAILAAAYERNFRHVREGGRVDDKAARIDILLAGESTIETAVEDELAIQSYGPGTAAAFGTSRIKERGTGRLIPYRWLAVYVRDGDTWRVALSQAARVAGEGR